jgi:hypothetical protein
MFGMMDAVMQPGMVYDYPLWATALVLIGAAMVGAAVIELAVRRVVPAELRRQHNDVAAAILSIIGITFAVLLAFVAMLAWEGFNRAKAASSAEAAQIGDVYDVSLGFADPERSRLRDGITDYVRTVVNVEWPAQAAGRALEAGGVPLARLNAIAVGLLPNSPAETNLHAHLLQSLAQLSAARRERLLAAETTVPAVVWIVTIAGGALTVAFVSFLGVANVWTHLAMSAVMAASGALVLVLIIALSTPFRGDFRVSAKPFDQMLARMAATDNPR